MPSRPTAPSPRLLGALLAGAAAAAALAAAQAAIAAPVPPLIAPGWPVTVHSVADAPPVLGLGGVTYLRVTRQFDQTLGAFGPDGAQLWQLAPVGSGSVSPPLLAPDGSLRVVVTERVGTGSIPRLVAIDRAGRVRWRVRTEFFTDAFAVGRDGTTYIGSGDRLVAVDARGRTRWRRALPGRQARGLVVARDGSLSVAAGVYRGTRRVSDEIVHLGRNGRILWRRAAPDDPALALAPDGSLRIVAVETVVAFADTGRLLWRRSIPSVYGRGAVARDGSIRVIDTEGGLRAVSATGRVLWRARIGGSLTSPAVDAEGNAYVGDSRVGREDRNEVVAVGRTGRVMWRTRTPAAELAAGSGRLVTTGAVVTTFAAGGRAAPAPTAGPLRMGPATITPASVAAAIGCPTDAGGLVPGPTGVDLAVTLSRPAPLIVEVRRPDADQVVGLISLGVQFGTTDPVGRPIGFRGVTGENRLRLPLLAAVGQEEPTCLNPGRYTLTVVANPGDNETRVTPVDVEVTP